MGQPVVLLDVRGVSKAFPGLKALDEVSLRVHAGEIVALVGHNGSGKSTLVKILAGVHPPDPGGAITVADDRLHFIHQDLALVPMLSTVENLGLGARGGLRRLRARAERRRAEELIGRFGARFDVTVSVGELPAAERAIVAIARALDGWSGDGDVLVLDEPTEALHRTEVRVLFAAVRAAAAHGAGVVFVSHRLDEVLELADRVVVLRDGRVIADEPRAGLDADRLVRLIVGIDAAGAAEAIEAAPVGEPILTARRLRGGTVGGLSFEVAAGEVVGVSGVLGSGREHVAGLVFGARPDGAGEVAVDGRALPGLDPRAAIAAGIAYVPADRRRHGGVMTLTARENITLPRLAPLRRGGRRLGRGAERREVGDLMTALDVRPREPERPLELFSGGNQQKVMLAKWLRNEPRVLLLDEPTQGVDVGAKAGIYQLVARTARAGSAVLVCSSDAKELALLCDRVLVLRDGALAAEVARPEISEERLLREALEAA